MAEPVGVGVGVESDWDGEWGGVVDEPGDLLTAAWSLGVLGLWLFWLGAAAVVADSLPSGTEGKCPAEEKGPLPAEEEAATVRRVSIRLPLLLCLASLASLLMRSRLMRSFRISASLMGGVLNALEGEGNQLELPSKLGKD